MNEQQQRRVNEAAEQFADALVVAPSRTISERSVSAQQPGAALTQYFFSTVINNLRSQAEDTRQMTRQLANEQQRVQEATRDLTQASVGAYMDFVNSCMPLYSARERRSPIPEATEAAVRWAEELGIDLHRVRGTGSGGRITVDDVQEQWVREWEVDLSDVKGTGVGGRITPADMQRAADDARKE